MSLTPEQRRLIAESVGGPMRRDPGIVAAVRGMSPDFPQHEEPGAADVAAMQMLRAGTSTRPTEAT